MASEEPVRRSIPERIGRYHIIERIGRGAMGVVYRAHDEAMGREVAIKVLTADFEDDPDIRTRFHREAEAAARLAHPNIINILDVGEDGTRFFIVMELLRGAPLKEFLKNEKAATLDRKLDLMRQLCAGMTAAHNQQIFHRDIKPGNLFVRTDGILKILDFGVARLASSSMTASGFIVGTPDYMSPEQACGTEVDGRSDIFSIGAVFYYMLSGRKPFPATHLPTLFHQIQSEEPAPLTDISPRLAAIVMKALAKQPDQRYQTCRAIDAELEVLQNASAQNSEPASVTTAPSAAASDSKDAADNVEPDTEDTVALPVGVSRAQGRAAERAWATATASSDETVSFGVQPSWWRDAADRAAELTVATIAWLKRATTPVVSGGNPENRKRSL